MSVRGLSVGVLILAATLAGDRPSAEISRSSVAPPETGSFTDPRDGHTYKTVRIGGRWLMAENLAYKPESGNFWAYDNNEENVKAYGYLYDWETAKQVAPAGWHLPSRDDWKAFRRALGGKRDIFKYLGGTMEKVYRQVIPGGGSGFDGLLGGRRTPSGRFVEIGEKGNFWCATRGGERDTAWSFVIDSKPGGVRRGLFDSKQGTAYLGKYYPVREGMSVRLFQD